MKRIITLLSVLSVLAISVPVAGHPTSQPASQKTEIKVAKAPASQPVVTPASRPAPASQPAATPAVPATNDPDLGLGQLTLRYIIEAFLAVFLAMLSILLKVLLRKYGFEEESTRVNAILEHVGNYVEQAAFKRLKLNGTVTPGADKMRQAVEMALKLAKEQKLAEKGANWWEEHLESWLGRKKDTVSNSKAAA